MTPHLPGRPRDAGAAAPVSVPPAAAIALTWSPRRPGEIVLTPAGPRSQVRIAQNGAAR
jgi:hypothetical protein